MSLLNLYHWKSSSVLVQSTISEEPLNPAYAGFTAVVFALQHQIDFPVNRTNAYLPWIKVSEWEFNL